MRHTQASLAVWKQRARVAAICVGVAALVPAVALTFPLLDRDGAIASAVTTAVTDPGSILSARSPGGRAPGALTQTKKRQRVASAGRPRLPTERVLSGGRTRPGAPFVDAPLAFGPGAFDGLPLAPVVLADNLPPLPVIPGVPVIGLEPNGPSGGLPGGGGGGGVIGDPGPGDDGDETTPPPPPPPPNTEVPAVPEPATWATFILGFLLVGAAMRRRSRRPATEQAG
jgi:hypothetical protein